LVSQLQVRLSEGHVFLNNEDVTAEIRSGEVTGKSRFVADSPSVRSQLTSWQRAFATEESVVTEGRDQGTIVFPDAARKYYLTASAAERARRRLVEYQARGESATLESLQRAQDERDSRDAARQIAPLRPADDATVIDTTGLTVDEVVAVLAGDIETLLGQQQAGL
jgi:cytidylate kinase